MKIVSSSLTLMSTLWSFTFNLKCILYNPSFYSSFMLAELVYIYVNYIYYDHLLFSLAIFFEWYCISFQTILLSFLYGPILFQLFYLWIIFLEIILYNFRGYLKNISSLSILNRYTIIHISSCYVVQLFPNL